MLCPTNSKIAPRASIAFLTFSIVASGRGSASLLSASWRSRCAICRLRQSRQNPAASFASSTKRISSPAMEVSARSESCWTVKV